VDGKTDSGTLLVSSVAVASVQVSPTTDSASIHGVVQFTATARDSAGQVMSGLTALWSSSDTNIATVTSGGLATGVSAGTVSIVAAVGGTSGNGTLVVTPDTGTTVGVLNAACSAYAAPAVPAPLRTFYIDAQAGNDGNNGLSAATAWKTLAKANQTARAGDLFLLAGTFANQWVSPGASGTASAKIVYAVAPGRTAVVSGGQNGDLAYLDNRNHIVVDGIEFTGAPYAIELVGSSFNWFRRLYVHDAGATNVQSGSSDNRIEDSRFDRIGNEATNSGDALYFSNGSNRNVIARNVITNAGHGAIWISYHSSGEATSDDNVLAHNVVDNPWASGIGLNGTANRTVVECNTIRHTADGSGPNYPRDGLEIEGTNNIIRYNEIYSNGDEGISIEGWTWAGRAMNATGNHIYNNTIWGNGGSGLNIVQKDGTVQNNTIENNIVWQNDRAGRGFVNGSTTYTFGFDLYHSSGSNVWPAGSANGNILRNNLVSTGQQFLMIYYPSSNGAYSLAQAQSTFAGWVANFAADPLFTNAAAGDFTLQAGSPAIDTGNPVAGQSFLGSAPDLGARERQ
jgi:hypothetical protein